MKLMLFAPELLLLLGSLVLFLVSTGKVGGKKARAVTLGLALINVLVCLACVRQEGSLFYEAYRIDFFSQLIKLVISMGFAIVLLFSTELKGIDDEIRPEYYLFLTLSTLGLLMLVSSVELLTMFIALELSSYSLYILVPMRDDRTGLRMQMESAIK
ncbi:MAG: NADH-quinone oxidoreductase subunit N, partial [Desulfurivibrionaceae bacterium]